MSTIDQSSEQLAQPLFLPSILGLDFGGTKLAAGLVDPSNGRIIASDCCPTPASEGAQASLRAMVALAHKLIARAHQDSKGLARAVSLHGVGVSFGGPVEANQRTVRLSMHVSGWENTPLADMLEQEFGAPSIIANDADAAALAEYHFGAGRGVRHMLYMTVSTGIGGGIIIDGHLHRGERAWAGEIGHMVLMPDGPACPCGKHGCLEALASGLSIARNARERLQQRQRNSSGPTGILDAVPNAKLNARDVAHAAGVGDQFARAIWDDAMRWLGIGIASAVNLLNPGRVVIGGGLSRAGALLFDAVRQHASAHMLDTTTEIVPAALGDEVGILGGAALMLRC